MVQITRSSYINHGVLEAWLIHTNPGFLLSLQMAAKTACQSTRMLTAKEKDEGFRTLGRSWLV